jgi:hypothetical protein
MQGHFVGNEGAMTQLHIHRMFYTYAIPGNLHRSCHPLERPLIERMVKEAIEFGGDFRYTIFTDLIRHADNSPGVLLTKLSQNISETLLREFKANIMLACDDMLDDGNERHSLQFLEGASECKLYSVRYLAVFLMVALIRVLSESGDTAQSSRLVSLLVSRCQDSCPKIRQFVCIHGIIETYLMHPHRSDLLPHSQVADAFRSLCRDPNANVRLGVLKYLHGTISKNRQYIELIRPLSRSIGEEVFARCFDSTASSVSLKALKVLSDSIVGDMLLGGDESKYQCLSLLVWNLDTLGTPKNSIAKEALGFVNNHVLASPGILSEKIPGSQKLLMMAEFIEQYSDGLVFALAGRFVLAYSGHVTGEKCCLTKSSTYEPIIDSLVEGIRSAIVRKGSLSRLFSVSAVVEEDDGRTDTDHKLRLNTVLEILFNAITIFNCPETVSETLIRSLGDLFLFWDEGDEPCDVRESSVSESQADVQKEALLNGIIARRPCYEIVLDILRVRFPEVEIPQTDKEETRAGFGHSEWNFKITVDAIANVLL